MSATSVGQIGLDLVVNQGQFNKQMRGVTGLAKKAGIALAAAFSVKKLVDFRRECVSLGSDLQEVQNVVDVTFPSMSKQVDEFAKNAAASFGLSETMAKRFTGTFGTMAKAFGFSEKQAYDMSSTLTGLAGDVASFYNMSQDEAYTKLKSVFTGETETLKELGVVMTQNALDAYALAKGYGKVTAKMSEAEKVALRYAFVQEKLKAATGDFIRTSNSWANQTRILKLQFDSLKATLGQGFINLFTPIIKVINTLLGKLMTLANAFKAFTELVTGNKSSPGSGIGSSVAAASEATNSLAAYTAGVGSAAKKAAKEMRGLMGFDKLNNIQTSDADTSGSTGGSTVDFGSLAEGTEAAGEADKKISPMLQKMIDRMKELGNLFKEGFKAGLGDDFLGSLQRMKDHLAGIKDSLIDIATDKQVVASFNTMCDKIAYAIGQNIGSIVSVGMSIAENLLGGIDKYLEKNSRFIKDRLVGIFDATGEIAELIGNFNETFASILEVFRSDTAKQCTADLIGVFVNGFLGVLQLGLEFGRDILNCVVQPIIDNAEKIKKAFENALSSASTYTATFNQGVKDTFDKIFEVYDAKIRPAFEGIADGLSSVFDTILDAYNAYIAPVEKKLAEKFAGVWETKIQPALNKAAELFGSIAQMISALWQNVLAPFINWLVNTIVPVIAPIFETFGNVVIGSIGFISDALGGLIGALTGVADFLTCVFKGEWDKVWSDFKTIDVLKETFGPLGDWIKEKVTEIKESIVNGFNIAKEKVIGIFEPIVEWVKNAFETIKNVIQVAFMFIAEIINASIQIITLPFRFIWENCKEYVIAAWDFIKDKISAVLKIVKEKIATVWNAIYSFLSPIIAGIRETVTAAWEAIHTKVTDAVTKIQTGISEAFSKIKEVISTVMETVKGIFTNIWEAITGFVTEKVNAVKTTISTNFEAVKNIITNTLNVAKSTVVMIFDNIRSSITTKINTARDAVKSAIDKIKGFFNFKWSLPKLKLPHFSVSGNFSLDPPAVPKFGVKWYAKGGIIKTPTLAMMGEGNKHEAVVPLDQNLGWRDAIVEKLIEKMPFGGAAAGGGITAVEMRSIMVEMVTMFANMIGQLDITATFDRREAYKAIKQENEIEKNSTGKGL